MRRMDFLIALSAGVLSSPVAVPGPLATSSAEAIDMDPKTYWFSHAMGALSDVTEANGYITGQLQHMHGRRPFRIAASALPDNAAKTAAYRDATRELIAWLAIDSLNKVSRDFAMQRLLAYTGQAFGDATQWQRWYSTNVDHLMWSEERNQLVVRP